MCENGVDVEATFYELFMNVYVIFAGGHSILHLDGVTTYLKRSGRTTNDTVVLRSYKQRTLSQSDMHKLSITQTEVA